MNAHTPPQIAIMNGNSFINLVDPDPRLFDITDIADSLSKICMYTGKCKGFYSVAQHGVLTSMLVPDDLAFDALMRNANAAFLGYIEPQLKQLLPQYQLLEDRFDLALAQRYNLLYPRPPEIHQACARAFHIEVHSLFFKPWVPKPDDEIMLLTPLEHGPARKGFLDRFYALTPRTAA